MADIFVRQGEILKKSMRSKNQKIGGRNSRKIEDHPVRLHERGEGEVGREESQIGGIITKGQSLARSRVRQGTEHGKWSEGFLQSDLAIGRGLERDPVEAKEPGKNQKKCAPIQQEKDPHLYDR